jgi:hypothetical protein
MVALYHVCPPADPTLAALPWAHKADTLTE